MAEYENVAKQFVEFYYNSFDSDRKTLAGLYVSPASEAPYKERLVNMAVQRDNSMLTFESASSLGATAIVEKLSGLPFQKVKHQVSTLDAQPTVEGGVIILITGQLLVDEEQRPMNFSQTFQLMKDASGQYFVFNDIFKLVFG
ncbi:uncharacterized protein E0L32_011839 [Thyridium curvatum]|uniref:NTF2-related export protein n=1 Tax=Thyridium curvatum TaxID=1093900 RepID=A0A507BKR4_9PEZI|nr:uncharacterized protein E0L32_011839 [Thyridium curvatum]TPX18069.1 hypothetical protein E0L32_011839 [Thyridium curvatum]